MSPSVTVGPRVEFDPDHYPRIRVWSPEEGRDYYLYLHRLAAWAHGEIDDLWDEDHVHQRDGDRWNGHPSNLEGLDPADHDREHSHRVVGRAEA